MASGSAAIAIYKVPRNQVDVEALAQGLARYLQIAGEDTEYLSYDPTRRDKLFAELYKQPGVKPGVAAIHFVPVGGDPDEHLVPADAAIANLTPPKSFEDRVQRLHLAWAALMVFYQYKVRYALLGESDLQSKVSRRKWDIMNEWRRTEFARLFPDRVKQVPQKMVSTPPTRSRLPTPPPSRYSPKRVSEEESVHFLNNPHTMIGKQFIHSPPQDQDQEDRGTWEVISYMVRKVDTGVEHEYQVLLQAFGADPVPMDTEEVRYLLRYSTFAA